MNKKSYTASLCISNFVARLLLKKSITTFLCLLLGRGLLREHSLDDLLLFNEKRADDALAHARSAPGAAVGARHSLLALLHVFVLDGTSSGDALKPRAAVTALGTSGTLLHVVSDEFAT